MALHQSGEDYLEAILVLQKQRGMVRSVDVARYLDVSKPSVCHAVATLRDGGFLTMDSDYFLHLTAVSYTHLVFSLSGLGYLIIDAVVKRDSPVIHAAVLVLALTLVLLDTVAELLQYALRSDMRAAGGRA